MQSRTLRLQMTEPQARFFQTEDKYPAFIGGFGSGKTETLANCALRDALESSDALIALYEPTYDLVRLILAPRMEEKLSDLGIRYKYNKQENIIYTSAPNCGDWVMVEGYSRELSSCGFWPGGGEEGAFYSYAYPALDGFAGCSVEPAAARFDQKLGEFLLPYEAIRTSANPQEDLMSFLQSTYEAAADLAEWDRQALECDLGIPRIPTGHAEAHLSLS